MDPPQTHAAGEAPEALFVRARGGEPDAVEAWFRREHPVVYRLSFGFLADAAEAEDVAQDAMLHLIDRSDAWDPERSYRAWRDRVVLNLCRDRLRRDAARGRAHARAREAVEDAAAGPALPDAAGPLEALERAEVARVLRESLASLSPREREAFVLRDLEELPTAEVAATLEITPGTVRSLLTLARRRLRRRLAARLPGIDGEEGER
jgi:RNA polymerase sigma-70 factor (ECF subfamily)